MRAVMFVPTKNCECRGLWPPLPFSYWIISYLWHPTQVLFDCERKTHGMQVFITLPHKEKALKGQH